MGESELQVATIRLVPSMFVEIDKKVKSSVLGIDYAFEDNIIQNITFKKNLWIDVNGKVPTHDGEYFTTSDISIMMDHDFTEREFLIRYFGYADILAKIGGLTASLRPILGFVAPIFIINYLITLSDVIMNKNKRVFNMEVSKIYYEF